jgi:hypothetical protein
VIARRKREIIERECFGLIEFVEPGHDFRVVGGIEGVKAELQRIAARSGKATPAASRWGCCSPGRWARARPSSPRRSPRNRV